MSKTNCTAANDTKPFAHTIGSKYSRDLDVKDIAKLVRADIKAAIKAGKLPKGIKCSVTIDRYSMGQSLRVNVQACPGIVLSTARIAFEMTNPHAYCDIGRFSAHGTRVLDAITAIVEAYNYDNSDTITDYHCNNFHTSVEFSNALENMQRSEMATAMRMVGLSPQGLQPLTDRIPHEPRHPQPPRAHPLQDLQAGAPLPGRDPRTHRHQAPHQRQGTPHRGPL